MLISVIIPAFNSEDTIIASLNSVKNQTIKDFELIVVNDGSTDTTLNLLEEFKLSNPTIDLLIISQSNSGVASARNKGIAASKGDYIAFLDSDDVWIKNKLEYQLDIFNKDEEIMLVGGNFIKSEKNPQDMYTEVSFYSQLLRNHFLPSTVMFKRTFFNTHGGFPEGQRYAEEGMPFYLATYYYKCVVLHKNLIVYGNGKALFGESGLSSNLIEMEKGELLNLKRLFKLNYIGQYKYMLLVSFSLLKFFRRIILVLLRKMK